MLDAPIEPDVELCVALGGDGTILRGLHHYAGTGVPVFAINYGEVGFLATVEPDDLHGAVGRALRGEFELLHLPAITVELPDGGPLHAMNDLAITRKVGDRVAELAYSLDGEEAGSVRCDGLVVATPGGLHRLQPRQRRPGDGVGRGRARGLVHRATLDDRAGARGRAGRRHRDPHRDAPAARRRRRRPSRRRRRAGGDHPRAVRQRPRARWPSCRARRSTGACARSSAGWRAEAALRASTRRSGDARVAGARVHVLGCRRAFASSM